MRITTESDGKSTGMTLHKASKEQLLMESKMNYFIGKLRTLRR
jgi:hypothetical protein